MLRAGNTLRRLILVIGDLVVFTLALLLTLWMRYGTLDNVLASHAWPFGIVIALWLVGFYIVGLYDLGLSDALKLFRVYLEGMLANLAVAVGFFYLIPVFGIAPRTNLFVYFALSLLLGYAWRMVHARSIGDRIQRRPVLFVGPATESQAVFQLLTQNSLGLQLSAVFATDSAVHPPVQAHWLSSLTELQQFLDQEPNCVIVLGVKLDAFPELNQALYQSLFHSVTLLDRAEIEELVTGRIPLSHVNETWFLHHLHEPEKEWFEVLKRALDLILAIPVSCITAALYPLIALSIKLSSKGPALYSQERVGKNGSLFRIYKFRSMHTDSERAGPQFTASAKTDPRLFTVGRWLRRLRLDELPQVWNVLKGDLSFVGPRPERPEFVKPLVEKMPYYQLRHLTRPGLTGWAQVKYLTPVSQLDDNLTKLQYDLYYIKHRSPLLDLAILLKTIGVMIRRQGT